MGAPDPWDNLKGQWTFDDMLKIATLCSRVTGDLSTSQWGLHMGYTGMSEAMGMFVWSFGGTWADFDKMRYTLDSRESVEAHTFVYDWVVYKKLVIANADVSTLGGGEKPFSLGKVGMRVLRADARLAAEAGILLMCEYHPGLFANTCQRPPHLVDKVDSPAFRGCLDFCHADVIAPGQSGRFISALRGRLGHVHIADGDGTPTMYLPLGRDASRWSPVSNSCSARATMTLGLWTSTAATSQSKRSRAFQPLYGRLCVSRRRYA